MARPVVRHPPKIPTPPTHPPTLQQAVRWLGRLGGHLGRTRDGEPGVTVLWKGFQHLADLTTMYRIMKPSLVPYIKPAARPELDEAMDDLIDLIQALPVEEQDGALNYTVTRMLKSMYPHRYFHYNRAIGALECIKQEFYRVDIGPYEDIKIARAGEVRPHGDPGVSRLPEHVAKRCWLLVGLAGRRGAVATTPAAASTRMQRWRAGRGQGARPHGRKGLVGAVRLAETAAAAGAAALAGGVRAPLPVVEQLLVEEWVAIERELYAAVLLDGAIRRWRRPPVASTSRRRRAGRGAQPLRIDPWRGLAAYEARRLWAELGLRGAALRVAGEALTQIGQVGLLHHQLRLLDRHQPRRHADLGDPPSGRRRMAAAGDALRRGDHRVRADDRRACSRSSTSGGRGCSSG